MRIRKLIILAFLFCTLPAIAWSQLDSRKPLGSGNGILGNSSLGNQELGQQMPLLLEEAFPYYVSEVSPGKLRVTWNPAQGHYLYRHAFNFALKQTDDGKDLAVEYALPDGLKKTDQFFGPIEAYYNQVDANLDLPAVPGPGATLIIEYQGCADWGFCYPPQQALFKLVP